MIALELVYNLALLVALSVFAGFLQRKWRTRWQSDIMQGVLFGIVVLIGMLNPVVLPQDLYSQGVFFDGRSVIISLGALFFGPLAAGVIVLIAGTCRILQGGAGTFTGILVISSSAIIGLYFHHAWKCRDREIGFKKLLVLGVLVQVVMLLLFITIPGDPWDFISKVALPIMIIYPLATVLVGKVLTNQDALRRSLDELWQSREQFRTTLYSIGDAVITTGPDARVRQMNPIAEQLTHWTEEEARGKPLEEVFNIISEETRQPHDNPAQRVLAEGIIVGLANHTLLIARDGTERPIADSGAPIRDAIGNITGVALVFRDQSEERAAEDILRASEERYRTLFESNPNPMWVFDSETLAFLEVNDAAISHYGYTREEFLAMTIKDIRPPQDIPRLLDSVANQPRGVDNAGIWRHVRKDGSVIDIEIFWHSIQYQGRSCKLALAIDVTERLQSETRLRELSGRFQSILDNSPLLISEMDREGRYLLCNHAIARLFDTHPEELLGTPFHQYLPPEVASLFMERFRQIWETREPRTVEDCIELNGEARTYSTVLFPLLDTEGNVSSIGSVGQDITEREQAEEQQHSLEEQLRQSQKLEAVGRLAGGVAHDFNNMLGAMMGHAELALMTLTDEADPSAIRDDLQEIIRTGKRSAELTRQLLAFARKQTISPRVLDLNHTVSSMLRMLDRLIGENIELTWRPAEALWDIKMDPAQIDQILVNLIVNARDAIETTGKIIIETRNMTCDEDYCQYRPEFLPGEYAVITVSDTGTGIPKELLDQVFEPFFTTKEMGKGTGLGLATVYGIVRQNGGFINVYSEPGQGATFRIYIPRHDEGHDPARREKQSDTDIRGNETILYVEDEDALLALGKRMLTKLGYNVIVAPTPREAIRHANEHKGTIHLLVSDVVMPGMSGKEVLQEIRAIRPAIKCVFVSGYTADVIAHQGVLEDGMHFLQKPFKTAELGRKIRQALDK